MDACPFHCCLLYTARNYLAENPEGKSHLTFPRCSLNEKKNQVLYWLTYQLCLRMKTIMWLVDQ